MITAPFLRSVLVVCVVGVGGTNQIAQDRTHKPRRGDQHVWTHSEWAIDEDNCH